MKILQSLLVTGKIAKDAQLESKSIEIGGEILWMIRKGKNIKRQEFVTLGSFYIRRKSQEERGGEK